eukprot:g75001.t1
MLLAVLRAHCPCPKPSYPPRQEACIDLDRAVLLLLGEPPEGARAELDNLTAGFCGRVLTLTERACVSGKSVYLCGDLGKVRDSHHRLETAARVMVIRQLSHGAQGSLESYQEISDWHWRIVDLGQVPLLVHGLGVLYLRFFNLDHNNHHIDFFQSITSEHTFQTLTESTKPGTAHRTGLYLSPVHYQGNAVHFQLLRCSSNLAGPTENFRQTDWRIVNALNAEAASVFNNAAPMNHVLAQIYHNTACSPDGHHKPTKAKIKAHADKTKDMPSGAVMAFCTFYHQLDRLQPIGPYDYGHRGARKGVSGLTTLHFRLKQSVVSRQGTGGLVPHFSVTLYPNSVFLMPISTNRLYTHEIRPPVLAVEKLPTRLGYVVRCSATPALHRDGQTYLKTNGQLVKLLPPTPEGTAQVKRLYAEENLTHALLHYPHPVLFSMNQGDYMRPAYQVGDEFRCLSVAPETGIFHKLLKSVCWEELGKGRRGTVLVRPDRTRGTIPIVRTAARYRVPAQCFQPLHSRLARQVQHSAALPLALNNALIEIYSNSYSTMGFHSDQAQDLPEGSYIALFSCYRDAQLASAAPRKLVVQPKVSANACKNCDSDMFEIPLAHNSVVIFSVETNRHFRHKIVLDSKGGHQPPENDWLGVTFRTSSTLVQYEEDGAYLSDGSALTIWPESKRSEFYQLRGSENKETDFTWPVVPYTISESDLIPPRTSNQIDKQPHRDDGLGIEDKSTGSFRSKQETGKEKRKFLKNEAVYS